jgi:hypothetical protein
MLRSEPLVAPWKYHLSRYRIARHGTTLIAVHPYGIEDIPSVKPWAIMLMGMIVVAGSWTMPAEVWLDYNGAKRSSTWRHQHVIAR